MVDEVEYATVEHYYQSMKATSEEDRNYVRAAQHPAHAKNRGRKVECRSDWEQMSVYYMSKGLHAKFTQHPVLKDKLLATGSQILREGNTWHDMFWGVELHTGEGRNMLGQLLMALRDELR